MEMELCLTFSPFEDNKEMVDPTPGVNVVPYTIIATQQPTCLLPTNPYNKVVIKVNSPNSTTWKKGKYVRGKIFLP